MMTLMKAIKLEHHNNLTEHFHCLDQESEFKVIDVFKLLNRVNITMTFL